MIPPAALAVYAVAPLPPLPAPPTDPAPRWTPPRPYPQDRTPLAAAALAVVLVVLSAGLSLAGVFDPAPSPGAVWNPAPVDPASHAGSVCTTDTDCARWERALSH